MDNKQELIKQKVNELAQDMTIQDVMISVLESQKQIESVALQAKQSADEAKILVEEVNKRVHIDDVEASEIKRIIGQQAYAFAKEYFEQSGKIASDNLFASKKGQFIRLQHSRLKHHFNVTKYTHIKHTEAKQAFEFLKSITFASFSLFEIRETPKQKEIIALENAKSAS